MVALAVGSDMSRTKIVLSSTALVVLALGTFLVWGYFESQIPTCDAEATKEWLKRTFDSAQFARSLNLSAVRVSDASETKWNEASQIRECAAAVTMNNAKTVRVTFKVFRVVEGKRMTMEFNADDSNLFTPFQQ